MTTFVLPYVSYFLYGCKGLFVNIVMGLETPTYLYPYQTIFYQGGNRESQIRGGRDV